VGSGISLSGATTTNPAQMTDDWVDKVIAELGKEGKGSLANAIEMPVNNNTLTKIAAAVDTGAMQRDFVRVCKRFYKPTRHEHALHACISFLKRLHVDKKIRAA
jgi:hypothetical protein